MNVPIPTNSINHRTHIILNTHQYSTLDIPKRKSKKKMSLVARLKPGTCKYQNRKVNVTFVLRARI